MFTSGPWFCIVPLGILSCPPTNTPLHSDNRTIPPALPHTPPPPVASTLDAQRATPTGILLMRRSHRVNGSHVRLFWTRCSRLPRVAYGPFASAGVRRVRRDLPYFWRIAFGALGIGLPYSERRCARGGITSIDYHGRLTRARTRGRADCADTGIANCVRALVLMLRAGCSLVARGMPSCPRSCVGYAPGVATGIGVVDCVV